MPDVAPFITSTACTAAPTPCEPGRLQVLAVEFGGQPIDPRPIGFVLPAGRYWAWKADEDTAWTLETEGDDPDNCLTDAMSELCEKDAASTRPE